MPDFDKLQKHVDELSALLKYREPGRVTWTMSTGGHWKAIVDLWNNQKSEMGKQKNMTPERAKELEGAAVVYSVGFTGGQIGIVKGVLMDVGSDYCDKTDTTALLIVNAIVKDLPKHRRDFSTLLITDWETMFEYVEGARAHVVNILKNRIDAISKEIRRYS